MQIVVCIKQTLDPEIPPSNFRIDPSTLRPVQGSAKLVMDTYAENALEVALQLKAKIGATVTAMTVGEKGAEEVLRRALAMTADEAVRIWDPAWQELDAPAVAHILARAIRLIGGADLVLCGRQAADIERSLVGPMLAEELGFGCVTVVRRVEADGAEVRLHREVEGGIALVQARLPQVVTVTNDDSNVPRLPKVKDLLQAGRKPVRTVAAGELDLDGGRLEPSVILEELTLPTAEAGCEIVDGDDGPARGLALAERLRALRVV
ncbi:MAG TPA: electron transfer flavoprotein subunit beta/FixA family protein [Symbiobacteriaceae bacterium]|nr:electron transfer flavoprotein subunit beta/FixA family protein [Symbiobacteriaceae bacterium]